MLEGICRKNSKSMESERKNQGPGKNIEISPQKFAAGVEKCKKKEIGYEIMAEISACNDFPHKYVLTERPEFARTALV